MGKPKALSIRVIFLVCLTLFIPVQKAKAIDLYAGGSYSFAGVIAESKYYNGASDWAPGFILGMQYGRLGIEAFMKKFTLEDDVTNNGNIYHMEIENLVMGLGLRIEIQQYIDFNLGMNTQNVEAKATSTGPRLNGLINKDFMSWYVGGGLKFEVIPNLKARLDMAYYKGDIEFGLFGIDFSLVYTLTTF